MAKEKGIFPPQRDHARGVTTSIGIIIIIAVAVVAFGGVFGYQYLIQQKGEPTIIESNQPIVGNDRDAHGCIGSAGYTWCEAKQKCLRTWEEPCQTPQADATAGWKTYTNTEYGFEIKYPTIETSLTSYPPYEASITLPIAEKGMNTNIDQKKLSIISMSKDDKSKCVGPNYYNKTSDAIIGGIQFVKRDGGEGAAGHSYKYIDYTTFKNNICIVLSFSLSSFNDLQNPTYTGGKPLRPYDFSKEEPLINQIMSTFKFTK